MSLQVFHEPSYHIPILPSYSELVYLLSTIFCVAPLFLCRSPINQPQTPPLFPQPHIKPNVQFSPLLECREIQMLTLSFSLPLFRPLQWEPMDQGNVAIEYANANVEFVGYGTAITIVLWPLAYLR